MTWFRYFIHQGGPKKILSVSAALNSCFWVHLACHGFQNSNLGMKSAFVLHNGHLELGEIASKGYLKVV